MIYELIQDSILPKLQALNSIERLAGLTKTVNSEYKNGEGMTIRQSFPIAAHVSHQDCFNGGMYSSLCPDSSKISVAFFREKSATKRPVEGARKYTSIPYQLQFCAWFNLVKLGISEPYVPFALTFDIINTVQGTYRSAPVLGVDTKIEYTAINQHTPRQVFGEYTFGQEDSLFMYPYCFLGIDFEAVVSFDPACLAPFTPSTPISCQII